MRWLMQKIKVIIHLETEDEIIGIKDSLAYCFEKFADIKGIEVEPDAD